MTDAGDFKQIPLLRRRQCSRRLSGGGGGPYELSDRVTIPYGVWKFTEVYGGIVPSLGGVLGRGGRGLL